MLEFSLVAGKVAARVQGSRPAPYKVTLAVQPLTAPQWKKVESRLAAQALFRARLLAGEMPAEIEQVFAEAGTPLFPESARDLAMDCNCPDWGFPCKHVAAVCYVLAEAFDDDPFAMLAWRGKSREALLAALRAMGSSETAGGAGNRAAGRAPAGGPADRRGLESPAMAVLSDLTGQPLEESLADFWSPGLSQARLRATPPSPATPADLLLRVSEPPPALVRGRQLRDLLTPAYTALTAAQDESAQSLKASLAFSPAFFRSPATWSFLPSASMFGSLVFWPAVSLAWPIIFSAAFLALSMNPMHCLLSSSALPTPGPVSFPGVTPASGSCYVFSIQLITNCNQNGDGTRALGAVSLFLATVSQRRRGRSRARPAG